VSAGAPSNKPISQVILDNGALAVCAELSTIGESYHMHAFDKKVVQTTKAAAKEISRGFSRRDDANKNGTT
jgi:hypothetical protein